MTPKNRFARIGFHMSPNMHSELRKECFRLGVSQQAFIRALVRDYFIRNHGIDLDLQRKERVVKPSQDEPSNDTFAI
jgi:hypothetical protein